jgi:cytochrome c biogenesis protein
LNNSKDFFFKKEKKSFTNLPFFVKVKNLYYLKELILVKIQKMNFYIYQNKNVIYGYKGLIGRISPILVHFSLIIILIGSSIGAFKNFKAQEVLPKGELFHIQNPINVGWFTEIPHLTTRVNDFWVEYEKNKIHQFYSNLSILNNYGDEIKEQTISVNNPLRYKNVDFYQSDWNLLGIRIKNVKENKIYEFPLFSLKKNSKAWITWVNDSKKGYSLIFDQFQFSVQLSYIRKVISDPKVTF